MQDNVCVDKIYLEDDYDNLYENDFNTMRKEFAENCNANDTIYETQDSFEISTAQGWFDSVSDEVHF